MSYVQESPFLRIAERMFDYQIIKSIQIEIAKNLDFTRKNGLLRQVRLPLSAAPDPLQLLEGPITVRGFLSALPIPPPLTAPLLNSSVTSSP